MSKERDANTLLLDMKYAKKSTVTEEELNFV